MSYAVLQAAAGFGAEPTTQAEMDQRWRAMCATGGGDWLEASHACSYAPTSATPAAAFPASYYLGKQLQCGSFGGQWVDKSKSCIFPFTAVVPAVLPPAPTPTPLGPAQPPSEPPVVTPSEGGTILGLKPLHAAALGIAAVVVVMAARKPAPPKAVPNRRRRRGLLP